MVQEEPNGASHPMIGPETLADMLERQTKEIAAYFARPQSERADIVTIRNIGHDDLSESRFARNCADYLRLEG